MQKIRIRRANTPWPSMAGVNSESAILCLWFNGSPLFDYVDELRQQALWDQKCTQQSKRAS